jgi:hypothetical protein
MKLKAHKELLKHHGRKLSDTEKEVIKRAIEG